MSEAAAALAAAEPKGIDVWPENMAVVDAWAVVSTQWRTTALGEGRVLWHGLDYGSATAMLDRAEISLTPAHWSGLRLMERTAAATLNGHR